MWYVLAAANALSGDSELIAGTQLRVPEVGVSKNDASTFKPYNPNEIVGSTSPGLPYIPPPGSLSCKQTLILLATTIVRVAAGYFAGPGGVMIVDALMQKVEINSGIRSEYSLGETVAAGVFAAFAPTIQGATGWARAGYAAVAAATAYTGSYLVDKARGADVHFNWSNLAASVVTSMISNKLGAVGNTGVAAGGTVSSTLNSAAFSWAKVASDAVKNLAISVVNKGVTQLITGDKAQWDAGAMFADSFGNALGSEIAVKLNQKILSYDERRSLKAMTPQAQNEYKANRAQGMSSRQAYDYVTNAGGLRAMGEAWFGLNIDTAGISAAPSNNLTLESKSDQDEILLSESDKAAIVQARAAAEAQPVRPIFDSNDPHSYVIVVARDGTWNDRLKMSFDTNSALLSNELFDESSRAISLYLRGVGTGDGLDKYFGGLTGWGSRKGNEAQLEQLNDEIDRIRESDSNAKISVVYTGFSRGAFAIRELANLAIERRLPIDQTAMVIFDTVGSMGMPGNGIDLGYSASISPQTQVLHLTANNETRYAFPLMRLGSQPGSTNPNWLEIGLPGAHSDVGGGYPNPYSYVSLEIAHSYMQRLGLPMRSLGDFAPPALNDPTLRLHDSRYLPLLGARRSYVPYTSPQPSPGD